MVRKIFIPLSRTQNFSTDKNQLSQHNNVFDFHFVLFQGARVGSNGKQVISGEATLPFSVCSYLQWESVLKGKNLLFEEQNFSLGLYPLTYLFGYETGFPLSKMCTNN